VQLSTATLRELFHWLSFYGFEYVIDRQPPDDWNTHREFKSYANVMLVRNPWTGKVTTIFTRVMSDPNPLRGVEFSWYWIDESRDMPQEAHDVVLSRMRESDYIKGILTTTPAGEDWSYRRFCTQIHDDPYLYGSMHVKTYEAVKAGIISQNFYDGLRASYSELMAQQELDAMHVNVYGGRAYYAFGAHNSCIKAPWGDTVPNPDRPLIVGCDFNFDPAPHIWMVGQIGPSIPGPDGRYFSDQIHWFGEISGTRMSSPDMAFKLISRYPGFSYRIYGDRSGARATTSNAGRHDYAQIGEVLASHGCIYSIDTDQSTNPLVRNRIENMNRMARDARGVTRMTYNPYECPHFDSDIKMVGWKMNTALRGQGKLDDGGNKKLTHASDGAGYAVWKLFPPGIPTIIVAPIESYGSSLMRNN
jgi:hypothetical protein